MLNCQKDHFQLEEGVTYLNCGYMSPIHKSVEQAGINAITQKRNPHKVVPDDFFSNVNRLKAAFSQIINCPDSLRIAIVPSVSYGMANVANNLSLKSGDKIIIPEAQFPSNYYPWSEVAKKNGAEIIIIGRKRSGREWNEDLLSAIDHKVKLVAVPNIHWADGTLFMLDQIREKTRQVGAWLVIDGTQSVGALPFDVSKIQPDALVCAGYKCLMGPYSMGMAYYGEAFDNGSPIENNWINRLNSEDFKGLVKYQDEYQPGAARYSVGEHSNFILVPMMLEALNLILGWGVQNIQDYCRSISADALDELTDLGYRLQEDEFRVSHLFGIDIPEGIDPEALREHFLRERISVSFRGDSIRVSPNVYNDQSDFSQLMDCMKSLSVVR